MRGFIRAAACADTIEHFRVPARAGAPLQHLRTGNSWPLCLGLWLIAANLRRRGFNRVRSSATDKTGSVDLAVARLAGAVDDSIEQFPGVTDVSHRVAMDRSRPTVTWTVTADPNVDVSRLRAELENSETDFRSAVRDMDLDTVYRLHVNAVKQQ